MFGQQRQPRSWANARLWPVAPCALSGAHDPQRRGHRSCLPGRLVQVSGTEGGVRGDIGRRRRSLREGESLLSCVLGRPCWPRQPLSQPAVTRQLSERPLAGGRWSCCAGSHPLPLAVGSRAKPFCICEPQRGRLAGGGGCGGWRIPVPVTGTEALDHRLWQPQEMRPLRPRREYWWRTEQWARAAAGASPPEPRIRETSGGKYRGELLVQVSHFTHGEF